MNIKNLIFAITATALIYLTGCLERQEEITVDVEGNTHIKTSFDGEVESYPPLYALPLESPWTVEKREVKATDTGSTKFEIISNVSIPFGEQLPDRYDKSAKDNMALLFPTEVKKWKEGKRTYYEFTRNYSPRKYLLYNLFYEEGFNKELEDKILEAGLFNVEEKERQQYLTDLTTAFGYSQARLFYEILSQMALSRQITIEQKYIIFQSVLKPIDALISPEKFEQILKGDDSAITKAHIELNNKIDSIFSQLFIDAVKDQNKHKLFEIMLEDERLSIKLTETIGGHEFGISLNLPGDIIITNGLIDPEKRGYAYWNFKGNVFNDCEYTLHALSVVEE